jgi:hypothetical protein
MTLRGRLTIAGIGMAIYLLNLIPPEYGYRAGVWTREMLIAAADHAACLIAAAVVAAVSFFAGVWAACYRLRG